VKKAIQYSDIATCLANALKFRFVLMVSGCSSEEHFDFITGKKTHFMAALKDNRLIPFSNRKCVNYP
jgi:hypothetical protein